MLTEFVRRFCPWNPSGEKSAPVTWWLETETQWECVSVRATFAIVHKIRKYGRCATKSVPRVRKDFPVYSADSRRISGPHDRDDHGYELKTGVHSLLVSGVFSRKCRDRLRDSTKLALRRFSGLFLLLFLTIVTGIRTHVPFGGSMCRFRSEMPAWQSQGKQVIMSSTLGRRASN